MFQAIIYLSFSLFLSEVGTSASLWQNIQALWIQIDHSQICLEEQDSESCLKAAKQSNLNNELHKAEYYSALGCQFGAEEGCRKQHMFHDLRRDRNKDYKRALKQYQRRCQNGLGWTCSRIGTAAEKAGKSKEAFSAHTQGCTAEFPLSCQWLSFWYKKKQEHELAQEFKDKANVFLHKLQYGIAPTDVKYTDPKPDTNENK
ncbi:MAG: hypothetical protein AB8C84_04145 [Oligoflexales bacterium]